MLCSGSTFNSMFLQIETVLGMSVLLCVAVSHHSEVVCHTLLPPLRRLCMHWHG